jgi:AraC-like DNA-binding protein
MIGEVVRQGFDPAPILAASGCEVSWLDDTERMIPVEGMLAAAERAIALTGDVCLGLHMAENARPEWFGLHTYLASTSATLREALGRVIRFMNLIASNHVTYTLSEAGDEGRLVVVAPEGSPAITFQWNVAVNHCFIRALVEADWRLREVAFSHAEPSPAAAREYTRIFDAPVRFSMSHDGLRFDRALLDAPMRNRDDRLCRALEQLARAQLEARQSSDRTSDLVRVQLLQLPADTEVRLPAIARRLAMSPRTLQRRLGEEGITLRRIVDEIRFERARSYLSMEKLSTAEVAFLLGFAEPAAFHRAFVRWTGMTPQRYRRERTEPSAETAAAATNGSRSPRAS